MVEGRLAVVGDDHPLAGGEAVVLHDVRRAELVERGRDLVGRRSRRGRAAVGTPAAAMTSLANALEPSSRAASADGPKHGDPAARHGVGDARDQRRLGPDHDEPDAELAGQGGDGGAVHRVDVVQRGDRVPCPGLPGAACTR